jgi:DNA-binding Xre family transcriptional regulator
MKKITMRYLPKSLSKDRKRQSNMLKKSRRLYKKCMYYTRKNVKSFVSKPSNHVKNAQKMYHIEKISASDELARKTGCKKEALEKIVEKGEGAYYSSGSRPNQTAQSWGHARLASAITSGKAAAVDFSILEEGCREKSKALALARKAKEKYGYGQHRVPKVDF